jgi:Zn-finger nucleic acid-binding protein
MLSRMKCPKCYSDLIDVTFPEGITLNTCPNGDGFWILAKDFEQLITNVTVFKTATAQGASASFAVSLTRACPKCEQPVPWMHLEEGNFLVCATCDGYWLFQGSLTALYKSFPPKAVALREGSIYARVHHVKHSTSPETSVRSAFLAVVNRIFWPALSVHIILAIMLTIYLATVVWESGVAVSEKGFSALVFGIGAGLYFLYSGMRLRAKETDIERTPRVPLNALSAGTFDVEGVAEADGADLTAPFTENRCVFYSWIIERVSGYSCTTIAEGRSEQSFMIKDHTGALRVLPAGADLLLHNPNEWRYSFKVPPEVEEGCKRLKRPVPSGWGGSVRCREYYLASGDIVYVLGSVVKNSPMRTGDPQDSFFIGKNQKNPFLISDDSEGRLIAELSWRGFGMIFGGPALSVACLYAIYLFYSK